MSAPRTLHAGFVSAVSAAMALAPGYASAQVEPASASSFTINRGGGSQSASLVLPFGKSAIIDLPSDARDILVSNPQVADATVRTPRRAYVIGRSLGQTNIFFFDANGRQIANVEIRVEPDVAPLNDLMRRHMPDSNITAEAVNASVVLSGTARSASEADRARQLALTFLGIAGGEGAGDAPAGGPSTPGSSSPGGAQLRLINLIQVQGSEQVLVRVRIVEMNRTLVRQLGVNTDFQLLDSDTLIRLATGRAITDDPNGGAHGDSSNLDGDFDASIDAFESAGLLRVLAEPNLTAISGESARFLAGGEFPLPVNSNNGQVTVEFKPYGVGLAFTPIVLSGGRISLKVSTEVSELTSDGAVTIADITIPALQVRRAETTVEMASGSAIVIAGLIHERSRSIIEGVPGAMDAPVMGALFRSRDFLNNETELVIIATPYIVRPTSPEALSSPADGFLNPSEGGSLLTGRLNYLYRPDESRTARDDGRLQGPHGHVIE
jgi:pilus assembly protein CpaC